MNLVEDCLMHLQNGNWMELNRILSDNQNATEIASSSTFMVFENYFIDELKRHETETNEDQLIVASRLFQIHRYENSTFQFSEEALLKLAKYLFEKSPNATYAAYLKDEPDAVEFLERHKKDTQETIDKNRISASLNVKIGNKGQLRFDKEIFNNSPQEKELFYAASKVCPNSILLPNTALSTIINPKVCQFLDNRTTDFFYKSTLDLCIVNSETYMPEFFIELDSSWHDKPRQIEKDKMKDEIFEKAGLTLERLRKIENKEITEIFKLYIKNKYAS